MFYNHTRCNKNFSKTFRLISFTNRQTDRQTNRETLALALPAKYAQRAFCLSVARAQLVQLKEHWRGWGSGAVVWLKTRLRCDTRYRARRWIIHRKTLGDEVRRDQRGVHLFTCHHFADVFSTTHLAHSKLLTCIQCPGPRGTATGAQPQPDFVVANGTAPWWKLRFSPLIIIIKIIYTFLSRHKITSNAAKVTHGRITRINNVATAYVKWAKRRSHKKAPAYFFGADHICNNVFLRLFLIKARFNSFILSTFIIFREIKTHVIWVPRIVDLR